MVKEHNIGVVAVFHVHGYEPVAQECREGRVTFMFSDPHAGHLAELREQFYGGTLMVTAVAYNAALRMYSMRLRDALRGNGRVGGAR